jgi:formylglycine-generating enzyme required for sulfatase activity
MRWVAGCLLVMLAFDTAAAEISQVTVRQRWPWSRLVDIDYVLSDAAQSVDIAVAAFNGTTPLTLPPESLTGDLYGVSADGAHRIVWDPTKTAYTNNEVLAKFNVSLTPVSVPLYMIVDLTKAAGAAGQIEYVYEEDLRAGTWGTWVEDPVTNSGTAIKSIVWTGVTNAVYKTDKFVLRRVPAGTVPGITRSVRITRPFYIGVYEVTQRQYEYITSRKPSFWNNPADWAERPLENVSYCEFRENVNNINQLNPEYTWPDKGHAVHPESFMGRLRVKTGNVLAFDLPTEAQWEYACRAGTTGAWNNGMTGDANMNLLGRYDRNGGKIETPTGSWVRPDDATYGVPRSEVTAENATAKAGSYLPNAWGLYDMHGNVYEVCLDYYTADVDSLHGDDPIGPELTAGSSRVERGGSWDAASSYSRSTSRASYGPANRNIMFGFRVAAPVSEWVPSAIP